MKISERLVEIREKYGYTCKRLSDALDKPYAAITKYENGERKVNSEYLVEIAKATPQLSLCGVAQDKRTHKRRADCSLNAPSCYPKPARNAFGRRYAVSYEYCCVTQRLVRSA